MTRRARMKLGEIAAAEWPEDEARASLRTYWGLAEDEGPQYAQKWLDGEAEHWRGIFTAEEYARWHAELTREGVLT